MNEGLRHLADNAEVPTDRPTAGLKPAETPLLEARDVTKRYGLSRWACGFSGWRDAPLRSARVASFPVQVRITWSVNSSMDVSRFAASNTLSRGL